MNVTLSSKKPSGKPSASAKRGKRHFPRLTAAWLRNYDSYDSHQMDQQDSELGDKLIFQSCTPKPRSVAFGRPDVCACHYAIFGPYPTCAIKSLPAEFEALLHISSTIRIIISAQEWRVTLKVEGLFVFNLMLERMDEAEFTKRRLMWR
jgi:hypothetical protein